MNMEMQMQQEPEKTRTPVQWRAAGSAIQIPSLGGASWRTIGRMESPEQAAQAAVSVNNHDALVDALMEVDKALRNGDLVWNRKRYADSDPYHPAAVKLCTAFSAAQEQQNAN